MVIEAIFHPETLAQTTNKHAHEALITTAVKLVDQHMVPLTVDRWSLYTHEAIREVDGRHFFAPGRFRTALGDDALDAVE